ncbi:MAG TPA: TIM barrel protein [Fimbriimonadaceae bacterium]|jgi:sugar phosphate isomerase/epimerase
MVDVDEVVIKTIPAGWDLSVFADEISPDLQTQLGEVRRSGLSFFDLRNAFEKNVLDLSDGQVKDVKRQGRDHSLGILCIGSPINKHPYNPADRRREYDRLQRILEIAGLADAKYIRIFSPFLGGGAAHSPAPLKLNSAEDTDSQKANTGPTYEEMRDWLGEQGELAAKSDKVLLLENDGDAYGAFPENAQRLFAEIGSPHFMAAFDFSNAVLLGYPALPHWFPWIMPYLGGLHIKDSIFAKDENGHEQIVPAGEGEGTVRDILEAVIAQKWAGPVSIEPHLFRIGKKRNLDGIGQYRLAVQGLINCLEGLV